MTPGNKLSGISEMPGNPRAIIAEAERQFPVGIVIRVPPNGIGTRYTLMTKWLDARESQVCTRLSAGAKEIRTLRLTLNAGVPRGATLVPRTTSSFGVGPS
jgi:hypothetical protein